jgi:hypothetical protein
MSKTVQIKINQFSGGISDNPRKESGSEFIVAKHFDIFSDPQKLTPYRSLETDTNDGSTATGMKQYFVRDFLYASASSKLYGLGQTGAGLTKIVYKADATTGNWTLPASSEGNGAAQNGCLVEYKDYLWGFQGTTQVFKWGILSGAPSITNSAGTVGTIYSAVTAIAINAAGTNYGVNNILTLTGGSNTATCIVTSVNGTGGVTGVTLIEGGSAYTTGSKATTVNTGSGSGCTITVSTIGNTSATITSVAQGIIALDDNLYLPYNNTIVRVYPSGTVQDQALKLPTNFKITSLTNYGKYLAIACAPISTFNGVSKVFLWNLYSSDVQEVIDWGEGELRILETIEGYLVGVTDRYLNSSTGAGKGSMIIQTYADGSPQVVKEVFTAKLTGKTIPLSKTVKNNRLFWSAKIFTNTAGTEYNEGIWSFGRKNANYPFALSLDFIDENVNTNGIQAIGSAGNFFFVAHSNDGSIDKTDDTSVFTFSSIYETQIFDFEEVEHDKRLESLKVSFAKLTTGQAISAKVKVDDALTWTTIGTYSTVDSLSRTFVNIEATDENFPSGREFKFQLISTGGAEIVSYTLEATPLSNI